MAKKIEKKRGSWRRKTYNLEAYQLAIISKVRLKIKAHSDSQTLRYILNRVDVKL